ncbi:retrovirus-related pol polyprotein from transposon TNT 1-94 [Tanacetum coccineum]
MPRSDDVPRSFMRGWCSPILLVSKSRIIQIILFIIDSACSKHITGNLKLIINFVETFLDLEVAFRKSTFYVSDLQGNDLLTGSHDLEVAFRKSTFYVCDLQGNDLLTGSHGMDLYTITLQESSSPTLIFFMAKASLSQGWLWHHRLSHLNFDTIKLLLKKDIVNGIPKLKYVKDYLCCYCPNSFRMGKNDQEVFVARSMSNESTRAIDPKKKDLALGSQDCRKKNFTQLIVLHGLECAKTYFSYKVSAQEIRMHCKYALHKE